MEEPVKRNVKKMMDKNVSKKRKTLKNILSMENVDIEELFKDESDKIAKMKSSSKYKEYIAPNERPALVDYRVEPNDKRFDYATLLAYDSLLAAKHRGAKKVEARDVELVKNVRHEDGNQINFTDWAEHSSRLTKVYNSDNKVIRATKKMDQKKRALEKRLDKFIDDVEKTKKILRNPDSTDNFKLNPFLKKILVATYNQLPKLRKYKSLKEAAGQDVDINKLKSTIKDLYPGILSKFE